MNGAVTSRLGRAPSGLAGAVLVSRPGGQKTTGLEGTRSATRNSSGALDARDPSRPSSAVTGADAKKVGPRGRTRVERSSWLRRIKTGAKSGLVGALLVSASFTMGGCGSADHSATQVSRPAPIETVVTAPSSAAPSVVTTPKPSPTVAPTTPPKSAEVVANEQLDTRLASGARIEYPGDFPDPFVLRDGASTYFYATNGAGANVPVLDAKAMLEGAAPREAFPTEGLGRWAVPNISHVWAPSVAKLADGRYALFYSAQERSTGLMAVGVAYAASPMGPFADPAGAPLVSVANGAAGRGGVIDASVFQEAGKTWVVFKNDGNSSHAETAVWIQELSADASALVGAPTKLLGDAGHQAWEEADYTRPHALVEGPKLVAEGGRYYLFYCANDWNSASYGLSYATADSPTGPFTRAPGPWMKSEAGRFGPGGPEIFSGPAGRSYLAYHAWHTSDAGASGADARRLVIEPLAFANGEPVRVVPAG